MSKAKISNVEVAIRVIESLDLSPKEMIELQKRVDMKVEIHQLVNAWQEKHFRNHFLGILKDSAERHQKSK